MTSESLVDGLRAAAIVLKPLARGAGPAARVWDGTGYADAVARPADAQAQTWWRVLDTMADMLERQHAKPTPDQLAYVRQILFGGMGSLTDYSADESVYGEEARITNHGLTAAAEHLLQVLEEMQGGDE